MLALAAISAAAAAPVAITGAGSYTQDFDSLPSAGVGTTNLWTNDTTLAGWYASQTPTTFYVLAGNGSSNSGGLYSFGATDSTERALGSLGSGTPKTISYGVLFQNTGTSSVTINALSYTGEQWRNGGNATAQKLALAYQKSSSAITTPGSATGWTALTAGDFTGPIASTTLAALDGNLAANQTAISTNPGIAVATGEYVMFRWQDVDDSGADHGLGIDNLTVSWIVNAAPALTLTANPTNFIENAGAAASTGTVTIPAALVSDLIVNLLSSDTTEATVPAAATITAGTTTATFPIDAVNDLLADGTQSVTLTASASGYINGQTGLTVDNDTDAAITVTVVPNSFSEGAAPGTVTGTVALAEVTPVDVMVSLTSLDLTEATVPESVIIPANQSSVTFAVTAVQDTDVDGDKSVRINATSAEYTAGYTYVTVTDDDVPPTPTLTAGSIAFTGFNSDGDDNLAFVALAPIPAGEVIFFTDNEWNGLAIGDGGKFVDANEGSLTWTAPTGGVAAGAVVTLNSLSATSRSASVGTIASGGSFNLGGAAETVYAYQGTSATNATGFLAVIATWPGDSTANTGLSASHIILLTTDVDIAAYTGSRSNKSAFADYLTSLGNTANWITEDGTGDQSVNGTAPDVPFSTTAFTLAAPGYGTWADAHAGNGTPTEDFDKDGVPNGVEYFMGAADGFTPNPTVMVSGGVRKVSWPHSATATGTTFKVKTSLDLADWTTDVTVDAIDADGKVEYTLPATSSKLFVRLEVTVAP